MIISIRGTSGSGKSTLVRKLITPSVQLIVENDKLVGHQCQGFRVVGPYYLDQPERSCGVDVATGDLRRRDYLFDMILRWSRLDNVVYEGLMPSNEVSRTVQHSQVCRVVVVFLMTPLELCLERINTRRQSKISGSLFGEVVAEPVNPKKTTEKFRELERVAQRLSDQGVAVERLSWDNALLRCRELLE